LRDQLRLIIAHKVIEDKVLIAFLSAELDSPPLMSRTVSEEPFSPATVESRAKVFVFFPTSHKNFAEVIFDMSWATSNSPQAPAAFAWTTLAVLISCVNSFLLLFLHANRTGMTWFAYTLPMACSPLRYPLPCEIS
jgi:hypothetical protein